MSGPDDDVEQTDDTDIVLRKGLRAEPLSPEALSRIRAAAEQQWRETTRQVDRPRYWKRYAAVAAVMLVSVGGAWFLAGRSADPSSALLGKLERADYPGAVEERRWQPDRTIASGEALRARQRIQVRGGARIGLPAGGSLRLAAGTDLQILSEHLVRLIDGSIYLDIPPTHAPQLELTVQTPAGTFSHVGTQFQIAVRSGQTLLQVREGQVRWRSGNAEMLADAGTQLRIERDGRVTREPVTAAATAWSWAEGLAASFEIENRSLAEFLRHVARETGRALVFSSPAVESRAATTILHGSIDALAPVEALSTVMVTTSMRFTLEGKSIRIESAGDAGQTIR